MFGSALQLARRMDNFAQHFKLNHLRAMPFRFAFGKLSRRGG